MLRDTDPAIKLAILFGSRASGKANANSDTDVAVLADHPLSIDEKAHLAVRFATKLNVSEDTIDLIDLWDAPPLLGHHVAEGGKLLEGSPYDFVRFRVLAWKRYLDTAKLRRMRSSALARNV